MKKIVAVVLIMGSISFTSCKKSYTCICTDGVDPISFTANSSKKDATEWCKGIGVTFGSYGAGITCSLK